MLCKKNKTTGFVFNDGSIVKLAEECVLVINCIMPPLVTYDLMTYGDLYSLSFIKFIIKYITSCLKFNTRNELQKTTFYLHQFITILQSMVE